MTSYHHRTVQPVRPSIRAAAHNPHSSGIARQAARPGAGAPVIQRMIIPGLYQEAIREINDLETLHRYINLGVLGKGEYHFVNNRAQTFKQAVNEFLKTRSPGYGEVMDHWKELLEAKRADMVKYYMGKIADIINATKSEYPDHPNAAWPERGEGSKHESPGTIPQTPESRTIANTLLERLNAEEGSLKKTVLEGTFGFEGSIKENFMLGVLVFPNKHVIVSVSGQIKALRILGDICATYLESIGFYFDGVYDTSSLESTFREQYAASFQHATGRDASTFSKEKGDLGNKPGTCAAAVALGIEQTFMPGNFRDRQRSVAGKMRLGLTEVFTGPSVTISNRLIPDSHQAWPKGRPTGETDIPSCETCQHQLLTNSLALVKLEKEQRLERYYPEQGRRLPESIKKYGEELLLKQQEKIEIDRQQEEAKKAAGTRKNELTRLQSGKGKELEELIGKLRVSEKELATVEEGQKSQKFANVQADEYCANYLNAKAAGNNNYKGKAAAYWWGEFSKLVPGMDKVSTPDRERKANEYQKGTSSNKGDSGGGAEELQRGINNLKEQIGLIEKEIAAKELEYKEAMQIKARIKGESSILDKYMASLKEKQDALKSKLDRQGDKINRDMAALDQLRKG